MLCGQYAHPELQSCQTQGKDIEEGLAGPKADPKERAKLLKEKYDWDPNEAQKIWSWGPETDGANVVVDKTQGVQYLLEIKEHVASAFQWITKEGPLAEEQIQSSRALLHCIVAFIVCTVVYCMKRSV